MTKLFQNGGSKAVRIPAEICPTGPEIFVWQEPDSKAVTISASPPADYSKFADLQRKLLPLLTEAERASNLPLQPQLAVPKFMQSGNSVK